MDAPADVAREVQIHLPLSVFAVQPVQNEQQAQIHGAPRFARGRVGELRVQVSKRQVRLWRGDEAGDVDPPRQMRQENPPHEGASGHVGDCAKRHLLLHCHCQEFALRQGRQSRVYRGRRSPTRYRRTPDVFRTVQLRTERTEPKRGPT